MQTNTYEAFAALDDAHGATALSVVLRRWTPGATIPQIDRQDPQANLNKFRRTLERKTSLTFDYHRSFATWSYGSGHRLMIEGFPRLDCALLAGIRYLVAPVQQLELHIATQADWTWLNEFHSAGTNGQRIFQLFEDTRLYWHVPDANLLLLSFIEPKEFGQQKPTPAGFCFFGRGLVCVIESRYRGGGGMILQWLQSQYQSLIVHHVLDDFSARFFQRYGFVDVAPPLPASVQTDIQQYLQQQRELFQAAHRHFGISENVGEKFVRDGRQRIMVWPSSAAEDPAAIAAHLSKAGLRWWYTSKSYRPRWHDRPHEERQRIIDFMFRAFGYEIDD